MTTIQLRRGTATAWSTANPVLADGEPGWDETNEQLRIGDGVTAWSGLSILNGPGGGSIGIGDLDPIATARLVGNVSGSTAPPSLLTSGQVKTFLAITQSDVSGLTAALTGKQTADANLTTFAGLIPTTDNVVQSVAGAWASRTPAQLKATLALVKGDVALGNVDNTSDASKPVSTATQTALNAKQPLDADLTAIAGLGPSANDVLQFVAGAWANRTMAQLKTALAIASGDVSGLGNLATATTLPVTFGVACSDETTALTVGTAKATFRTPHAFTLTAVRASLTTASSSGLVTVDINEGGVSVLSTKLSIDASERTSTTAATAAVISDSSIADDAEITVDIDAAGTAATGLKIWMLGTRSA